MVAVPPRDEQLPDFRDPAAVVSYLESNWNEGEPPGLRVKVTYDRPGPEGIGGAFYSLFMTGDEFGGPQSADVYISAEELTKPLSAKITFGFGHLALYSGA